MIRKMDFGRKAIKKIAVAGMIIAVTMFGFGGQSFAGTSNMKDVSTNYWAYDEIKALTDMGVIHGYPDGTYRPQQQVTRAQSAMLIVRILGIPTQNRPNPGFTDVSPNTSGYAEIATLVDLGVLVKAPRFNPNKGTSRAEMAKMLALAFELTGTSPDTIKFKDVPSNYIFYPYIDKLVANKITSGTSPTLYSPQDKVTRVQMAVFLKRVIDLKYFTTPPVVDGPSNLPPVPAGNAALMSAVHEKINNERVKAGLQPLKIIKDIQNVALIKAKDMADNNYFDHISPTYGGPAEMLKMAGITLKPGGENISAVANTADEIVGDWMSSPGHRNNILSPTYKYTGIGIYNGGSYGIYSVQIFAY